MEKEIYLAIGAIIGAVGSFTASLLTAKSQKELAEINAKRDIERDKLKYQSEYVSKIKERILQEFESAHTQLSEIANHFSLTGSSLNKPSNCSIEEFDHSYSEYRSKLNCITMLIHIYASDSGLTTESLDAAMNNYWGNYREYLRAKQQGQNSLEQRLLDYVVQYSSEICQKAHSLQYGISSVVTAMIS